MSLQLTVPIDVAVTTAKGVAVTITVSAAAAIVVRIVIAVTIPMHFSLPSANITVPKQSNFLIYYPSYGPQATALLPASAVNGICD